MSKKRLLLLIVLSFFTVFIFAKVLLPNTIPDWNPLPSKVAVFNIHAGNISLVDFSSNPVSVISPLLINFPPIANAGADTTLLLPTDIVTLRGCASSDPEMAALRFKWIKISGPGAFLLPIDSLCSVQVKGLIEGVYTFELTVLDTAGLTGKDTMVVTVNSIFSANWPPPANLLCNKPYKIVVLGSSTAFGTGADPIDSSWVKKLTTYLLQQAAPVTVVNLAYPGYTSYHISPTGIIVPPAWPITVDTLRNITKALSLNPDAIIVNLPSNDIEKGIPISEIQFNYNRIKASADSQQVPIWITSTQPRDQSLAKRQLQIELRDWIMNSYGIMAVDFWSAVSNPDGSIKPGFAAGDGIHLNNAGHHVLFSRIVAEDIWDTICVRKNILPIARAGKDTMICCKPDSLKLDGTGSYDPDGTVNNFAWRIINNIKGTITGAHSAQPVFSSDTAMDFSLELIITDNLGAASKDTILIKVNPAIATTYIFTGNGNWNDVSNWNNNTIPPAILTGNAVIIIDPLITGECLLNVPQKILNGATLRIMENKKLRVAGGCIILK